MIPNTPAGVADDDSPYDPEIPGDPTLAATPPITCAQSFPDFCHVDNVALEPPAPTTEITCVAPPTRPANHGASTRASVFAGAVTAAGRGTEELEADLAALLTDVVVGTALDTDSAAELTVVVEVDTAPSTSEAPTGAACGASRPAATTSTATTTAATTGHKTRTSTGTWAKRRTIPLSPRRNRPPLTTETSRPAECANPAPTPAH
ncbi:hypothetical protein GCM10010178_46080 [Lentzea flava]|uniref:Uncharacterized protein n=1 Tax=Lentzea flava TaxID=103732 RepID=A0ABQ2URU1_9PSEU|nr:hypothetical protein GCM10010178_46080 [Lentzea flava]